MNRKRLNIALRGFTAAIVVSSLFACGGGGNTPDETETSAADSLLDSMEEEENNEKVVYYATPSMVEIAAVIKSTGATFSSDILNDPANKKKYTTQYKRAVNMGIYGADLAYAAMFEETQTALDYLKTVKEMADEMGMTGVFEKSLIDQIQANITNRDSLLNIISDFYWTADAYLEDNNRGEVAALIIAGGWVEATYISADMAINSPDNKAIRERIAEQKLIVKNLMLLLRGKMQDGEAEVKALLAELQKIKDILDKATVKNNTGEVVSSDEKQETTIKNTSEVSISEESLNELYNKIKALRSQLIN